MNRNLTVFVLLVIALIAVACIILSMRSVLIEGAAEDPVRPAKNTIELEGIEPHGAFPITRFFDEEQGNVCYLYKSSISCVKSDD